VDPLPRVAQAAAAPAGPDGEDLGEHRERRLDGRVGAEVAIVAAAKFPKRVRSLVAATAFDFATPEMSAPSGV